MAEIWRRCRGDVGEMHTSTVTSSPQRGAYLVRVGIGIGIGIGLRLGVGIGIGLGFDTNPNPNPSEARTEASHNSPR